MLSKSFLIATLMAYHSTLVSSSPVVSVPAVSATSAVPAALVCTPAPYVAKNGDVWTVQCDYNYNGGQPDGSNNAILSGHPGVADTKACIEYCDTTYPNLCSALAYNRVGQFAGYCFCLSNTSNGGYAQSGMEAAVLQVKA